MRVNAVSVSRMPARAIVWQREEMGYHERRMDLEERLAEVESSALPKRVRW